MTRRFIFANDKTKRRDENDATKLRKEDDTVKTTRQNDAKKRRDENTKTADATKCHNKTDPST